MPTLIIDNQVMEQAAAKTGMTTAQLIAWFNTNYESIKKIRLYIQTRGVTEPEFIEQYASDTGPLDPTLVSTALALLETGGLITRLES